MIAVNRIYSTERKIVCDDGCDSRFKPFFLKNLSYVECIAADGEDLEKCLRLLGRLNPGKKSFTFFGDNAKEIELNW
jgi:hypothetical protein